jgi:hypothetical protein
MYTLLLGSTGTHAYNQTIYKNRRYDAAKDLTAVTLWSDTIPQFAALLKANGAKMQYGFRRRRLGDLRA